MTRDRQMVSIASSDRARIPFALVGVLVLITSVSVVGVMQTRDEVETNTNISTAVDETTAAAQSELTSAVQEATTAAAREPIVEADWTADTPAGAAISDGASGETEVFERYVKLRVYLAAERGVANVRQEIDESTTTRASLPDAAYSEDSLKDAIDRVTLTKGIESSSLDPGVVEAKIEGLTVEVYRDGSKVAERTTETTVGVSTTVFAAHEQVEGFEDKLEDGDFTGDGLGHQLAIRLYPMAWGKAGYERYSGSKFPTIPPASSSSGFNSIIENKEVEVLTNAGIFAIQREEFGTQDPRATRTMGLAYVCLSSNWASRFSGSSSSWATNSYDDISTTLCSLGGLVLGGPSGDTPDSIADLLPGGASGSPGGGNPSPGEDTIEVDIGQFAYPAKQDTLNRPIDWDHVQERFGTDTDGVYDDGEPQGASRSRVGSDPAASVGNMYEAAFRRVYSGSAELDVDDTYQDGTKPDRSDLPGAPDGPDWSPQGPGRLTSRNPRVDATVTKDYETAGATREDIDLYDITVEVTKTYQYKRDYRRDERSYSNYEETVTSDSVDVTYTVEATIKGSHSTAANVETRGVEQRFSSGADGGPNPDGYEPVNFRNLPREAIKQLVGINRGKFDDKSALEDAIENNKISEGSISNTDQLENDLVKSGETGSMDLGPEEPPGTEPSAINSGGEVTNADHLGDWILGDPDDPDEGQISDVHHEVVLSEVGTVRVSPMEMATGENPFQELRDRLDDVEEEVVYADAESGPYANAPDMVRAEARYLYMQNTRAWIDEINERRQDGLDNADSNTDMNLGGALSSASDLLSADIDTPDPENYGTMNSEVHDEITYKVRGSPTYLTKGPVMRRTVAAVRPAGEGPESAENTVYSTFASRNRAAVPNPGIPIVPWPGYWYASVNGWEVDFKGEYPRFEVSARTNGPGSTKPVTYVREEKPVHVEVNGLDRRAGSSEAIDFDNTIPVAVAMPGPQVYASGSWGTGDRVKPSPTHSKHELSECTAAWDYVGPGFNPQAATASSTPDVAGTGNNCGNKADPASASSEEVQLLKDVADEDTIEAGLRDLAEEAAENTLAGRTCLPGGEEDDDHVIGPGAGSGLPGAPPANVGYPDLVLDDDDDDEEHRGCPDENMTVRFIDMGKGASVLVTAPNGETMLIDAGDRDGDYGYDDITDAIERDFCDCESDDGTYVIDHFVLTHDHEDHNKYIDDLIEDDSIRVENWHRPPVPQSESALSDEANEVEDWNYVGREDTSEMDDSIDFGGPKVEVEFKHPMPVSASDRICSDNPLSGDPEGDDDEDDDNIDQDCNSAILELTHTGGDHTFLFPGDPKSSAIGKLTGDDEDESGDDSAENDVGVFEGVDVLMLPHHGTDSSYNEYMLEQIGHTAVISNRGEGDVEAGDARSPGPRMLDTLGDEDVGTYWTGKHGDVLFVVDEEGDLLHVAEGDDGDELDDSDPPDAGEFNIELPGITDALGPAVPGPLSAGTGALATGGA